MLPVHVQVGKRLWVRDGVDDDEWERVRLGGCVGDAVRVGLGLGLREGDGEGDGEQL